MIYIYRIIYFILKNLALILKPVLSQTTQKWIDLRHKSKTIDIEISNCIWFHASSGEIEYCKSVIRELKGNNPEQPILVTYSSASAEKLFQNIASSVDCFMPLCWDDPVSVKHLIEKTSPKAIVFSRTDFWPELITQALERKIILGVIAFNPSFNIFKNCFYTNYLKRFDFISCVNKASTEKLKALITEPNVSIHADGDTRFDQVFYRLSQPPKVEVSDSNAIFILGSTWLEDEDYWWPHFQNLINKNIKIILSPHDVSVQNIKRLTEKLKIAGFNFNLFSDYILSQQSQPVLIKEIADLLLVDQIGYLADLYRFSDIAFVGGSFKAKVHSVMEPLCCGLEVFVGPHYKNNPEAVEYLGRFVHQLPEVSNSTTTLADLIDTKANQPNDNILTTLLQNKDATALVVKRLQSKILKTKGF